MRFVLAVAAATALMAQSPAPDRTLDASGVKLLQIESTGGDVVFAPDPNALSVRVTFAPNYSALAARVDSHRSGDRLALALAAGTGVTIVYPSRIWLEVRAASGSVRVDKPQSPVEVYDENGNVVIDKPLGPVTVQTAHGDVGVTEAASAIDVAADAGSVTAGLAAGWSGTEIRMQSGSGDVRLIVDRGFRGRIDATAASRERLHDALGPSNARSPLVWLYAPAGEVWISQGG